MPKATRRILLIEDDEVLAEVTRFRLELLEFQVASFCDGEQAFASLIESSDLPHTILIDLNLKSPPARELIERITSDTRSAKIPLLAISHDANLDAVEVAFHAGVADILVAPFDPLVLERKVEVLVERGLDAERLALASRSVERPGRLEYSQVR